MPQIASERFHEDAQHAERIAELAASEDLRQELLQIAREFRREDDARRRAESRLTRVRDWFRSLTQESSSSSVSSDTES
jgi:hypothetical protein